jgi:hypothetical protein
MISPRRITHCRHVSMISPRRMYQTFFYLVICLYLLVHGRSAHGRSAHGRSGAASACKACQ